jgi:hypothetical protein
MLLHFSWITLTQIWKFAVHRGRVLADCIDWHATMKENLNFYHSTLHKCKYNELKLMLGFQIQIRLDTDLFDEIRILQGAMAVRGVIFHARTPIGIRVVAKVNSG